jgi:hypothetical protein
MIDLLIKHLEEFYDRYRDKRKENRQLADDALRAVSTALVETDIYYVRHSRGQPQDEETEWRLSKLWAAAAIPVRHIDAEFAQICAHKSDHWVNPTLWNKDKKIDDARIRLDAVKARFRLLLVSRPLRANDKNKPDKKADFSTEELRALIRQSNDKPVRIWMSDGRTFTVSHPDFALVTNAGIILASGPGHDLGNMNYIVLYFEHITRSEELKPKRKAA